MGSNLHLTHLLLTEASSEMVSVEGWLSRRKGNRKKRLRYAKLYKNTSFPLAPTRLDSTGLVFKVCDINRVHVMRSTTLQKSNLPFLKPMEMATHKPTLQ